MATPPVPPAPVPVATSPAIPAPPPAARVGDLEDRGSSRRAEVRARSWRAEGAARVTGTVEADRVELHGITTVGSRLNADELVADGALDVGGPLTVRRSASLAGENRIAGDLAAGALDTKGRLEVRGAIHVTGAANWSGHLEGGTSLTAGTVAFDGRLDLAGELEARTIDGKLRGASHVDRIRADRIVLRAGNLRGTGTLTALRLDAREADLEGVTCEYVHAERIIAGPGCHLAQVDGEVVRRHPNAHVGPESRSPRPHGLSR